MTSQGELGSTFCEIPLTQGRVAIVDLQDYEWLSRWKWHTNNSHGSGRNYAYRRKTVSPGKSLLVSMHREIMGLSRGNPMLVDHIDSANTLDNRRCNLRLATPAENVRNSRRPRTNTSGFKGVSRRGDRWFASISVMNRTLYLGLHSTPEAAHEAYLAAARKHFGEFLRAA